MKNLLLASLLFNVTATGTPDNVDFVLCLNGKGALSCQTYSAKGLNLLINTNIANHVYPAAGIKVLTAGYEPSGCTSYKNGYCLFSVSATSAANIVLGKSSYDLVTIGNPGNATDPLTGFGAVNYVYKIGKYDVTIKQYTDFLNAVAKTDTYGLYDSVITTNLNSAGINRSGTSGSFSYSVMDNGGSSANRPITFVTWFNAARFANWMSNGKKSGAQNNTTTENGAYALNGAVSGEAPAKNSINPNTGRAPAFYIPLENEWYKAAYYDPTLGGVGGYYLFATKSDTPPGNTIGNAFNQANYFDAAGTGFSVTQSLVFEYATQNYLTDVGAFTGSPSYYGTYDQNGNADQWNDLDGTPSLFRGLRGAFYFAGYVPMQSTLFAKSVATNSYNGGGFRLASPA